MPGFEVEGVEASDGGDGVEGAVGGDDLGAPDSLHNREMDAVARGERGMIVSKRSEHVFAEHLYDLAA